MRIAYFTVAGRRYCQHAAALVESLNRIGVANHIFSVGADDEMPDLAGATTIPAIELAGDRLAEMRSRYSDLEFCCALKPFGFLRLTQDYDVVVYLDSDILVLSPFHELRQAFQQGCTAILTPHLLAPLPDDGRRPSDFHILMAGSYNAGFVAFSNAAQAIAVLAWWADRLTVHCQIKPSEGMVADQRFLDLIPGFLDGCLVLRHPGYNVAYWNIAQRNLRHDEELGLMADEQPVRFVHFSGLSTDRFPSVHQDRLSPGDLGDLLPLFRAYLVRVETGFWPVDFTPPFRSGAG